MSIENIRDERSPARRLESEVNSWKPYADALRQEDRIVFKDMMNAISSYGEAVESSGRGYDTEALMMSILLNQQKAINWLSTLATRLKER